MPPQGINGGLAFVHRLVNGCCDIAKRTSEDLMQEWEQYAEKYSIRCRTWPT